MNAPVLNSISLEELESTSTGHVIVLRNDAFRVPENFGRIHVLTGNVWVTVDGQDIILAAGQEYDVNPQEETVVISALRRATAVVELL